MRPRERALKTIYDGTVLGSVNCLKSVQSRQLQCVQWCSYGLWTEIEIVLTKDLTTFHRSTEPHEGGNGHVFHCPFTWAHLCQQESTRKKGPKWKFLQHWPDDIFPPSFPLNNALNPQFTSTTVPISPLRTPNAHRDLGPHQTHHGRFDYGFSRI